MANEQAKKLVNEITREIRGIVEPPLVDLQDQQTKTLVAVNALAARLDQIELALKGPGAKKATKTTPASSSSAGGGKTGAAASSAKSSADGEPDPEKVKNAMLYMRFMFATSADFRARFLGREPDEEASLDADCKDEVKIQALKGKLAADPSVSGAKTTTQRRQNQGQFIWKHELSEQEQKNYRAEHRAWMKERESAGGPEHLESDAQ